METKVITNEEFFEKFKDEKVIVMQNEKTGIVISLDMNAKLDDLKRLIASLLSAGFTPIHEESGKLPEFTKDDNYVPSGKMFYGTSGKQSPENQKKTIELFENPDRPGIEGETMSVVFDNNWLQEQQYVAATDPYKKDAPIQVAEKISSNPPVFEYRTRWEKIKDWIYLNILS
jgi:hypothetical protein